MPAAPTTLAALRSLLAARFPEKTRRLAGVIPTGVEAVDKALDGGLPVGRLTELVSTAPSSGGQTVLTHLLVSTRSARQRVALVDGADSFTPGTVQPDILRHLVWVRCRTPAETLAAADLLVRDGNYGVVALDLRGLAERALRRQPATVWYRLQRAAEGGAAAVLVLTPHPLVPAVPWRLILRTPLTIEQVRTPRKVLAARLAVEIDRGHAAAQEELAG